MPGFPPALQRSLQRGYSGEPTQTAAGRRASIVPPALIETFTMFNTRPQTTFLVWWVKQSRDFNENPVCEMHICAHLCTYVRLFSAAAAALDLNLSLLRVTVKHWEHLVLSSTHKILSHPWVSCWNAVSLLPEMCSKRVSEKRHSSFACHKAGPGFVWRSRTSQCPY